MWRCNPLSICVFYLHNIFYHFLCNHLQVNFPKQKKAFCKKCKKHTLHAISWQKKAGKASKTAQGKFFWFNLLTILYNLYPLHCSVFDPKPLDRIPLLSTAWSLSLIEECVWFVFENPFLIVLRIYLCCVALFLESQVLVVTLASSKVSVVRQSKSSTRTLRPPRRLFLSSSATSALVCTLSALSVLLTSRLVVRRRSKLVVKSNTSVLSCSSLVESHSPFSNCRAINLAS